MILMVFGYGLPGGLDGFQGPDDAVGIVGMQSRGGFRIDLFEVFMEMTATASGCLLIQSLSDLRICRRGLEKPLQ